MQFGCLRQLRPNQLEENGFARTGPAAQQHMRDQVEVERDCPQQAFAEHQPAGGKCVTQIDILPRQQLGQAAFVRNSKRPDAALTVALLNICDMDIQRGFDIRAFLFPYGFGDAAGEKFENRDVAVCIICFILTDSNQQRYFTGVVDQPNAGCSGYFSPWRASQPI